MGSSQFISCSWTFPQGGNMETRRYGVYPWPEPADRQPALNLFKDLAVADICDAMGRNCAFPSQIKPLGRSGVLGVAVTVSLPASENLLLYYALNHSRPGDVLIVSCASYEERAVLGEIMAMQAVMQGIGGIVVDGAVRDVAALKQLDIAVYARAVSPNGPYKGGAGLVNAPVAMGNVVVSPGDIIVGDEDGLVAVPGKDAQAVAEKTRAIMHAGLARRDCISQGRMPDYAWLDKMLVESGCQFFTRHD